MKKDIYIKIATEQKENLKELPRFVSCWDYPQEEKHFYKDDLGKIETKKCVFRFIKQINVSCEEEKPFFLVKPNENQMKDVSFEEVEEALLGLIEK